MMSWIHTLAAVFREHLSSIAVGLVATVLVIYGETINRFFRKVTRGLAVVPRFILFVLLCSAGYGFLSTQAVRWVRETLRGIQDIPLILAVCGGFVLLGFLARRGREI